MSQQENEIAFADIRFIVSPSKVLDLSFNLLTTLPPLTYLSLRNLEADVDLRGNRWQCDCSMRSVRRWMFYDRDRGQPAWRVVCASPSALSGRDLLQLEEGDLTCSTADKGPGLHQDVTVDEGSEILLPCNSTHKGNMVVQYMTLFLQIRMLPYARAFQFKRNQNLTYVIIK